MNLSLAKNIFLESMIKLKQSTQETVMNYRLCLFLLILMPSILMTGCSGVQKREKVSTLQTAIRQYGQAVRWARYKNMYDFHLGQDGFRPKLNLDKYKGIQVTSFNVVEDGEIDEELKKADVVAEFSFYDEDYATVNTIKHYQHWWFEEESKRWFLDATLPEFRK